MAKNKLKMVFVLTSVSNMSTYILVYCGKSIPMQ